MWAEWLPVSVTAIPSAPARAVRPMRWTYVSGSFGRSKLTMCEISSTSSPRDAMSLAISTIVLPLLKFPSARCRAFWLLLPWIASEVIPALCSCFTTRSAPCFVRVNTSARVIALSWMYLTSKPGFAPLST